MNYFNQGGFGYGRRLQFGPGALSPFIKWMLIVNGGVLILQFIFRGQLEPIFGLTPKLFFSDFPNWIFQVFTYMFLHSTQSIFHIFFNMLVLWMFGTEIEFAWGSKRFGRFYILAGIAGAILTLIVFSGQMIPMIGASGAIYGVLVAYWFMFPNRELMFFPLPIRVRVKWAIPIFMLLGVFLSGANVAHMAHAGGAIFGVIYMKTDWRFASLTHKLKTFRYRRQEAKLEKRRHQADDVMKKVDAILDKINQVGIENLTKAERKFLEEASSELAREKDKTGNN